MADCFKHAPDLAIATLDQRDFVPRVCGFFHHAHQSRARLHALAVVGGDGNSSAQLGDGFFLRCAGNFDDIGLGNVRSRFHQAVRQFAIVGEQKQAFAGVIQTPDGIDAASDAVNQIHDRGALFRIAHRGDETLGLIEQEVDVALRAVKQLAIHAHVVGFGIGFGAEFGDDGSVDLHAAG